MDRARTFRTWLPLRVALWAAAGFWAGAFAVLAKAPGTRALLVVASAALVAFFVASAIIYGRTFITVTPEGIVAATPFKTRPVRYDDILRVVVRDGVGGRVYALLTRRGPIHFTSMFSRHRELAELILERAALRPQHA
jgi:hypothetical protein